MSICAVDGQVLSNDKTRHLCRCGGSRNKPFCDATHGLKGFDGTETASRDSSGQPAPEPDAGVGAGSQGPSIASVADGPYLVSGVRVVAADGRSYDLREQQTLCRCGQSGNKPFCDGSHRYAGFRDPQPTDEIVLPPTPFEWAGGLEAFERLTERFYVDILDEPDPILAPVFAGMDPGHPKYVAAWLAETFGGERAYTHHHGGYESMVGHHRNLALTEVQRARWVQRMIATADLVGLPDDPDFRATLLSYLEWGTRIAVFNSAPGVAVIEHAPVPRWGWGNSAPYVPQPWDDPHAATRGRELAAHEKATSGKATSQPATSKKSTSKKATSKKATSAPEG